MIVSTLVFPWQVRMQVPGRQGDVRFSTKLHHSVPSSVSPFCGLANAPSPHVQFAQTKCSPDSADVGGCSLLGDCWLPLAG